MIINVDWISFTGKRIAEPDDTMSSTLADAIKYIQGLGSAVGEFIDINPLWVWRTGRKPYSSSFTNPEGDIRIYIHPKLDHFLVELQGRACKRLSGDPIGWEFLDAVCDRLTRLDIAADMLCDTNPLQFVSSRIEGRFKSHSEFVSSSGTTCYIGSRTSDRYARVYRYNPPHERAHLLRAEFVVKAENARLTARDILDKDILSVTARLGAQFGFTDPAWSVEGASEVELRTFRPERRQGKTLYWLADTIAPLLVRLAKEGVLDPQQWLEDNVLSILKQSSTQ